MLNLINALNPQQWKLIGAAFLGTTGPIAWFLSRKLGLSDADVKMWLDSIVVITPIIGTVLAASFQTNAAQVQSVSKMPVEQKAQAVASLPAEAFASIAEGMPDEAKVQAILAMPATATAAAVANLSDSEQAVIAASLPDKAVITAAGAMPGIEVRVADNASSSALEAADDDNVPGVFPV